MLVAHIDPSASLFADFLHKIENMVYNTPGQYENIQKDTEAQRSERTTESGADRKKSKEMDMLNGGLAVGPNAALANLIGQKNRGKINSMVHTILTFGAVLGISLTTIFRMFTSYEMLMNVYVASWLFTGGAMFVIYFRYMKGLERQFMGNQG